MKNTFLKLSLIGSLAFLAACGGGDPTKTAPVINSFTVTPDTMTAGQAIEFKWDVTGATNLQIDNSIGAVTPLDKGSKSSSVSRTTTFLLKASNAQGEVSKSFKVSVTGPAFSTVETIAGQSGVRGGADGPGLSATFNYPNALAATKPAGATGNEVLLYISGLNEKIRYAQVGSSGNPVATAIGLGSSGSVDGDVATALVRAPNGIAIGYDSAAYEAFAYWTEDDSCVVRKLTNYPSNANRKAMTIGGKANACGAVDGPASSARFNRPSGIVHNTRTGETFVTDNGTIRRINGDSVTTIAGLAGQSGSTDGTGAAARFYSPNGILLDRQENLIVADYTSIRKVSPTGQVTTIAGSNQAGYKDGPAAEARFSGVRGIAQDEAGNIYVSETVNNTVRKLSSDGIVSTISGVAGIEGAADGNLSVATFNQPRGLAYFNKQLFVADTYNQTIRRIR